MAKVFSWKVAPSKYAYLEPENGSYIRRRITDSTTIHQMANTVESWSEEEYRDAFNAMKAEVNRVYGTIIGNYMDYYSIGGINGGTVVLLAGKDGSEGNTSVANQYLNETDYAELISRIDLEFERYKNDIMAQVEAVRNSIENAAAGDVSEAMDDLRQTREELAELRERLATASSKAQNALDAVRGLSMFADGEIDPSILEDILLLESRFNEWMTEYDGKIAALITDYDSVTQQLGSIAVGMSAYEGRLSLMLENINAISGTVGTVEQTWAANSGLMRTLATWYDESAATYAEVYRLIDASRAAIEDVVNFYNGETTSRLMEYFDGQMAEIGRKIETISDSVSGANRSTVRIEERLNGLSGIVSTSISRYDSLSGRVCTINDEMDAMAGSITRSLTVANDALQSARDMRDVWSQESGMIRSVTDMIIEVDENGDPIYYYIDPDLPDHGDESQWIRVYYIGDDPDTGMPIYNTRKDGTGTEYRDHVVPSYKAKMMSYILQNSNEIDMTVSSGDVISALRLAVTEDGSIIYMTADRVIIDSDVLANSLTAKAANIGGVHIGAGMISAGTAPTKWALGSDGVLEASGAKINGAITATSLTLGGGSSIEDYVSDRLSSVSGLDETLVNGLISGYVSSQNFLTGDALDGYVDADTLREWLSMQSGLTSAYIQTIINAMSGAQINQVETFENSAGGITHIITIGGVPYSWDTWDAGDFLLLNTEYSGVTDSGTARFLVSKEGLLQANNAIIYGQIYATNGWFKGSVSATDGSFRGTVEANDGYFKGSVSADNGYFHGDIVANSLTLGNNQSIEDFVNGKVAGAVASGMDASMVNELITNYLSESGITLDGYMSESAFTAWLLEWNATHSGQTLTDSQIEQLARTVAGAEITQVLGVTANEDGSLTHTITIGGQTYTWDTFDTGDYMLLGDWVGDSAHTGTGFIVDKNGLLQANNAIIYGKVWASESYLKGRIEAEEGYFRGSVSADNGYFHGDIVANSLTLSNNGNKTLEEYVNGRVADAVASGMDASMVNQLITDYVNASGDSMGFITNSSFQSWVDQWNLDHPDNKIDASAASAIAQSIFSAEISKVFSSTESNGVTTHTATIGDRTYSWKTVDTGDYVLVDVGLGTTNSGGTGGFIISREGLLEAYNALIYGKIYASEGYFKGNISADSGYFKGKIEASEGLIGGIKINANGLSGSNINITNNYMFGDNVDFKGSISATNGYFRGRLESKEGYFKGNVSADNGYFKGELKAAKGSFSGALTATSLTLGGNSYTSMPKSLSSGDVRNIVGQEANSHGWITTGDGYYKIGNPVGGDNFIVTTGGLLTAKNAILSGGVYATNGVFSGTVYAGAGKFKGDITADSLKLGSNAYVSGAVYATKGVFKDVSATNISMKNSFFSGNVYANNGYFKGFVSADSGYFKGELKAAKGSFSGSLTATSLTLGGTSYSSMPKSLSSGDVRNIVGQEASSHGWITAGDGYYKIGNPVGGDNFVVSTGGLLTAKNAILSGSVFATNGVFSGTVYATDGIFKGKLSAAKGSFSGALTATSLTLGGTNYTSMPKSLSSGDVRNIVGQEANSHGWITAGDGYYKIGNPVGGDNFVVSTGGLLTAKNAILSGNVYATNGVFSGSVYATNGVFKGTLSAAKGSFSGALTATSLSLGTNAATAVGNAINISEYYHVGEKVGTGASSVTISTGGLLTAKNAIISGSVFATNGVFSGSVYATNGIFKGELKAASGSFKGAVSATSLWLSDSITIAARDNTALHEDDPISAGGGNTYFNVSSNGQLTARNANIKGTICAETGYFRGTVYANDGSFRGSVSAINGCFSGTVFADKGRIAGWNLTDSGYSYTGGSGEDYLHSGLNHDRIEFDATPAGNIQHFRAGIDGISLTTEGTIDALYIGGNGNTNVKFEGDGVFVCEKPIIGSALYGNPVMVNELDVSGSVVMNSGTTIAVGSLFPSNVKIAFITTGSSSGTYFTKRRVGGNYYWFFNTDMNLGILADAVNGYPNMVIGTGTYAGQWVASDGSNYKPTGIYATSFSNKKGDTIYFSV